MVGRPLGGRRVYKVTKSALSTPWFHVSQKPISSKHPKFKKQHGFFCLKGIKAFNLYFHQAIWSHTHVCRLALQINDSKT